MVLIINFKLEQYYKTRKGKLYNYLLQLWFPGRYRWLLVANILEICMSSFSTYPPAVNIIIALIH
jgi:hypothetical protein